MTTLFRVATILHLISQTLVPTKEYCYIRNLTYFSLSTYTFCQICACFSWQLVLVPQNKLHNVYFAKKCVYVTGFKTVLYCFIEVYCWIKVGAIIVKKQGNVCGHYLNVLQLYFKLCRVWCTVALKRIFQILQGAQGGICKLFGVSFSYQCQSNYSKIHSLIQALLVQYEQRYHVDAGHALNEIFLFSKEFEGSVQKLSRKTQHIKF
eukprot:TRINITY_DN11355_c0_g2_i3.p1 TRINITY_DN11355_c0_g2~~TRINITY_DN11355_c0_g2_i3.p1  ORF type:complete len:225 (-),score=-6.13 TRINITY_DN11355_c0_g2_i3:374-994(-)